jgi:hypothetical protein
MVHAPKVWNVDRRWGTHPGTEQSYNLFQRVVSVLTRPCIHNNLSLCIALHDGVRSPYRIEVP